MKKYLFLFLILLGVDLFAQCSAATPSGYTSFINLRKYANGVDPCADSLNANSDAIDAAIKRNYDSLAAHRSDIYSVISYSGSLRNSVVGWTNISSAAKAYIVQTTGAQSVAGLKTFGNGGVIIGAGSRFNLSSATSTNPGDLYRSGASGADLLFFNYGTSLRDTIASQRWVRANSPSAAGYASLSATQTLTGTNTFSGNTILHRPSLYSMTFGFQGEAVTELTGTSGRSFIKLSTAYGNTISTIPANRDGEIIVLWMDAASQESITVNKDGNIFIPDDTEKIMSNNDTMTLIYNSTTSKWVMISYTGNDQ